MMNDGFRKKFNFLLLIILIPVVFMLMLTTGPVNISIGETLQILFGKSAAGNVNEIIIMQSRLPMAVAAIISGSALSASGLLMQTVFRNPLAGPSVLGVSSGASLGVSLVMLAGGSGLFGNFLFHNLGVIGGAILGSGIVIGLLLVFSPMIKESGMLLIIGLMLSYLTSSVVTMLNFFAPSEDVKSFAVWGMGSFMGLTTDDLPLFTIISVCLLVFSLCLPKYLNVMLLGDRYVSSSGYNVKLLRGVNLVVSGLLTAIVAAYCGPIGFIGLIVPHLARMLMRSSNHFVLLPATILLGSLIVGVCALLCVLPSQHGVVPVNAITPIIGVPVILYILIRRNRLFYFN